jgi:hypothetical protein
MTEYLGKRFPKKMLPSVRFTLSWEHDESGCWNWLGRLWNGYGRINVEGKTLRAHRYSWMLRNGREVPAGMVVCHSCDNPKCVNPDHLFLGTPAENVMDCVSKGRHARGDKLAHPRAKGEKNGNSRLTKEQASAIRFDGRPQRVIAAQYGVCRETVGKIKRGELWK